MDRPKTDLLGSRSIRRTTTTQRCTVYEKGEESSVRTLRDRLRVCREIGQGGTRSLRLPSPGKFHHLSGSSLDLTQSPPRRSLRLRSGQDLTGLYGWNQR